MVKNPSANVGDVRDAEMIPGLGRSPGGGHGSPLQCSCLENPWSEHAGRLESMGVLLQGIFSTLDWTQRDIQVYGEEQLYLYLSKSGHVCS